MVKRLENWPILLSNYLQERKDMPFEWGVNDCLTFLAKGAEAMTGYNYYNIYSGYTTEEEAYKKLEEHGGIIKIVSSYLGSGSRNYKKASRGDVAVVKMPELMAGIVDDSGRYVALVSKDGLVRCPLEKAWRVWRF
jgi:hypothetical protein